MQEELILGEGRLIGISYFSINAGEGRESAVFPQVIPLFLHKGEARTTSSSPGAHECGPSRTSIPTRRCVPVRGGLRDSGTDCHCYARSSRLQEPSNCFAVRWELGFIWSLRTAYWLYCLALQHIIALLGEMSVKALKGGKTWNQISHMTMAWIVVGLLLPPNGTEGSFQADSIRHHTVFVQRTHPRLTHFNKSSLPPPPRKRTGRRRHVTSLCSEKSFS